jgi:hypothetical protein
MSWLTKIYNIIFGCLHSNLSRVFTIRGETYVVCFLCGTKFAYSLDTMSVQTYKAKTLAQGFLILGLSNATREAGRGSARLEGLR